MEERAIKKVEVATSTLDKAQQKHKERQGARSLIEAEIGRHSDEVCAQKAQKAKLVPVQTKIRADVRNLESQIKQARDNANRQVATIHKITEKIEEERERARFHTKVAEADSHYES